MTRIPIAAILLLSVLASPGCTHTIKAVGDPDRPIVIEAHIVIDIRGLQQSAASIEDMIAEGS